MWPHINTASDMTILRPCPFLRRLATTQRHYKSHTYYVVTYRPGGPSFNLFRRRNATGTLEGAFHDLQICFQFPSKRFTHLF